MPPIIKRIQALFCQYWICLIALLCSGGYEQGSKNQKQHYDALSEQLKTLQEKTRVARKTQKTLKEQVASQSDTKWNELTLIKELGVVPEGHRKIMFSTSTR